ncbi:bifunctional precorrin-2 dehydrogenase/sirohydrochlorin ferrochelatase [Alkalihalobacillus sp. LMS39]|uniref:precorrin-2 dehydrogenase/sirohydrochlorin ferrochelatase family protein n=1 Tax=Alkalihalobacillus sp. LMS39 TaxID=2924032 RepID=UPI001FB5410A|nr:bifunctional precorrin-2 dehydrogenase/sirohydrochlorin ferrochelatase [Alkalihalobacillus sp. LMS39]UOE95991.1 bifunctional precorrin-2 dehydrogenase/sirohydrochlorin ferrochelatase [Alkalihalobacillus sp. LMS39]
MSLYPIMLQLENKEVFVVGGGKIALRKVIGLLDANATVTVISPTLHEQLIELVTAHKINWIQDIFKREYIQSAVFIFAATNDSEINEMVYKSANEYQFVNRVDDQKQSDFYLPSVLQRGKLMITVSTNGASPTLAKKIKQELEHHYDESYCEYVDFLAWARTEIKHKINDERDRKFLLKRIIDDEVYKTNEKYEQVKKWIRENDLKLD